MNNETAPGKRSARHANSARSRYDLLTACAAGSTIDARLLNACKSQGGLANVDAPDLGISPMSLNTLKRASEAYIPGGFDELNRLRRIVVRQRAAKTSSEALESKESSEAGRSEVQELREQRQKLVDSCAFMADQYNDLLMTFRRTLDRIATGRADAANERRLLESHLKKFRGPAQPLSVVEAENSPGAADGD